MTTHSLVIGLLLLFPWSLVAIIVLGSPKAGVARRLQPAFVRCCRRGVESFSARRVS
jgi:hypothetical protein